MHVSRRLAVRWLAPLLAICGVATAVPALAGKTVVMTPTTINTALATLAPGDTLRPQGTFTSTLQISNRDFGGVQVDASGATLLEGMHLQNVHNISFAGGVYGRTDANNRVWHVIRVLDSSNFGLTGAQVVGDHDPVGGGLYVNNSSFVTVRNNDFVGHMTATQIARSTDSLIFGNRFVGSRSDGAQLISNQRVIIAENSCTGFSPTPDAHPDCIQLWSDPNGNQSTIYVLNNTAIGSMQAFVSLTPHWGTRDNITFAGNYAAVTWSHGVSCYSCVDSQIIDNVNVTLPDAPFKVITRTNGSPDILVRNNPEYDLRGQTGDLVLPDRLWSFLEPTIAGLVGSVHLDRSHNSRVVVQASLNSPEEPVPEPATWLLMLLGFTLVGRQLRRQGGPAHVMA